MQTITAHYKFYDDTEYSQYYVEVDNPVQNQRIYLRLEGQDFQKLRRYTIYLQADNEHTEGIAAQSQLLDVTMPGNIKESLTLISNIMPQLTCSRFKLVCLESFAIL